MARARALRAVAACASLVAVACSGDDEPVRAPSVDAHEAAADATPESASDGGDASAGDAPGDAGPCPFEMELVGSVCMDRHEAPNRVGELPFVMFTFDEAEAWCIARKKRLCFDDEWTQACEGPNATSYPYGDANVPGVCNDEETWKLYDQMKLNGWPWTVAKPDVESLSELFERARVASAAGKVAADHVEELYQGEAAGQNAGCVGAAGIFDLTGNVEEWTRRRDGGSGPDFSGSLKGRYWAEPRTCQSAVETHGDGFRFYEIGFRCCRDL